MDQPEKRRKSGTLFRRMLVFLLVVLLLQSFIYLAVFYCGGILSEIEGNAFDILNERTANRKLDLKNDMVQRWSNMEEGRLDVLTAVEDTLTRHESQVSDLTRDRDLCQEALSASAESLVAMLRRNGVTGVFAILDCKGEDGGYPGVYIRDYDPMNYSHDNADLLLERGLPQLARNLGIPMDSYWNALCRFDGEGEDSDFFFRPMDAARAEEPENRQGNYFYRWSKRFSLSEMDRSVVTYTVPLVCADGTVIGVIGVDLTVDYLAGQLKYDELGEDHAGAYLLGVSEDGGKTYTVVCASGPSYQTYFGSAEKLAVEEDAHPGIVLLPDSFGDETVYGSLKPLKLYNTNTPFEQEEWALISVMGEDQLLQFSHHVQILLLFTLALSLLLGLVVALLLARTFTRPISRLMDDLRKSDPNKPIQLPRTDIAEMDALSESVEDLSNAAATAAARVSKIISMSHIPVGVFEYHKKAGKVFCGKNLFEILQWPERPEEDAYLEEEEFLRRLWVFKVDLSTGEAREQVFRLPTDQGDRWVQLFYREEGEVALGVFLDVTEDVEVKHKIEYERDYDILTGLYNRRAFDQRMEELLEGGEEPLGTAALLMLDLDNLKYINDTYGHDYGDRYIQAFARSLEYFDSFRAVVGRRSGDEFNVFLYGYESEEKIRCLTADFWTLLESAKVCLADGGQIGIKVSGGLAWYGKDADDYNDLLRLADFAMYSVKHTVKGRLREFDRSSYLEHDPER